MALSNNWTPKLGLDLSGGTTITLTAENTSGTGPVDPNSLELARTIIQKRVDSLGVGESEVTTAGNRQIIVSVPNVQQDELVKLVGQTAVLRFRPVYAAESVTPPAPEPTASPSGEPSAAPSGSASSATEAPSPSASAGAPSASSEPSASATGNNRPFAGLPTAPPAPTTPRPTVEGQGTPPDKAIDWQPSEQDQTDFAAFSCTDSAKQADVSDQPLFSCDEDGTAKYLLGPSLIEGKPVSSAIPGGRAEISGNFNQKSATQLADVLKYGALPLSFEVSQVSNVSATLGKDQLRAGMIAGIVGLALVVGYCFLYYRGLGIVVVTSLAVAAVITYEVMVLLGESVGFALNLAGIAGAIVAIGVTADSFVIYFERIRDEVRDGRSLRTAVETGWRRARQTILIADAVSLLSALILFILAIGSVKGFAFTLGLTTLIDVLVVFMFTKPLLSLLARTRFFGGGHRLSGLDPGHLGVRSLPGSRTRRGVPFGRPTGEVEA